MKDKLNLLILFLVIAIIGCASMILYTYFKRVPIENIILDKKEETIYIGSKTTINATIIPDNATDKTLIWDSDKPDIAKVIDGEVTGLKEGKAIITASSKDQKVSSSCKIKVEPIKVKEIKLSTTNIKLQVGEKNKIEATITPENATYKELIYKSSNPSIVEVDNNGNIEAKSVGNAKIIVTNKEGKVNATCTINVHILPEKIELDNTSLTLNVRDSKTLNIKYTPDNVTSKDIKWESSDNSIATVVNGKVTGVKVGRAKITATHIDTGKAVECNVTVKNVTFNKTAIFFGDSITNGKGYSWANYIGEHYDLKGIKNAGISGGVLTTVRGTLWIPDIVSQNKNTNYDYVIMHGGINDISMGVAIGTITPNDFSGNYNKATLTGGLEYYIYLVKKQWPNAKIGYIVNYDTPLCENCSKHAATLYPKIMEVLKKWNVSYINLYSGKTNKGVSYSDLLKVSTKTYLSDGVHLTREGYNLLTPYIYDWMKTL